MRKSTRKQRANNGTRIVAGTKRKEGTRKPASRVATRRVAPPASRRGVPLKSACPLPAASLPVQEFRHALSAEVARTNLGNDVQGPGAGVGHGAAGSAVAGLLTARESTHGRFHDGAGTAQLLKSVLRSAPGYDALSPVMKEALDQDMSKTARILAGDARHVDHWIDKAGYSGLVIEELRCASVPPA